MFIQRLSDVLVWAFSKGRISFYENTGGFMLKSYSAIYKQGHLEWLDDRPEQENVPVIVTFIEANYQKPLTKARFILEQAWGCVEKPRTLEQIDRDISQMREEWE